MAGWPADGSMGQTDLEEGQVMALQSVGHLQVLEDHRAVGEHSQHVVIVILMAPQQGQLIAHSLTH